MRYALLASDTTEANPPEPPYSGSFTSTMIVSQSGTAEAAASMRLASTVNRRRMPLVQYCALRAVSTVTTGEPGVSGQSGLEAPDWFDTRKRPVTLKARG